MTDRLTEAELAEMESDLASRWLCRSESLRLIAASRLANEQTKAITRIERELTEARSECERLRRWIP